MTPCRIYDIINGLRLKPTTKMGCRQAVRHGTLTPAFVGPNPAIPAKKSENLGLGFFYPSRRLGISSAARRYIIKGGNAALVYHHAIACIFLRLDDIQCFALMICNSYGIDDIHAFGVIGMRECERLLNCFVKYDIISLKGVTLWQKTTC